MSIPSTPGVSRWASGWGRTSGSSRFLAFAVFILGSLCFGNSSQAQSLFSQLDIAGTDPAPAGSPALLEGGAGVTAIAGRVLAIDGRPLSGVRVVDGTLATLTDDQGRFLLKDVPAGESVVTIDGRGASPPGQPKADYGYYEMRVPAKLGMTTALPYVDWLTPVDHAHDVAFTSPAAKPVVVTTPAIPGLELRIPAGAVLTDPGHKPVTHVGLTQISTKRPPFPLPRNVHVPVYFTAQPGGTVISSADGTWLGAKVVYPNYYHNLPRAQELFWRYDPDNSGWSPYGTGTVTNDARQVVPNGNTRIYAFSGAMISSGPPGCSASYICGVNNEGPEDGEPVDLGSGSFRISQTDLTVSDVNSIDVTRSYNSATTTTASFGAGMSSSYDVIPMTLDNFASTILSLPNGTTVPFACDVPSGCPTTPAPGQQYISSAPGEYYNAILAWHPSIFPFWTVTRTDGTIMFFPWSGGPVPVTRIQDRFGNAITITRNAQNQIEQITSPSGKFIAFTYTNGVVTQATDNAGRTFQYGYDSNYQMLQTVKDPDGGVTTYGWNNGQITTISDPRTNTFVTNQYDSNLRVHQQTLADGSSKFVFNYTLGSTSQSDSVGLTEYNVVQTTVTDPNQNVRTLNWDLNGYILSDTLASNSSSLKQTTAYCRAGAGSLNASNCPAIGNSVPTDYVSDVIDALGRDTNYTYDGNANVLSVTYLYGSSNAPPCASTACTYSFTYSPEYNQISSVTNPRQQTTQFVRGLNDEVTSRIDPLGDTYTFGYNPQGQATTITDAVTPANTTTLSYTTGDLTSITDPLGRTTSIFTDTVGRPVTVTDAMNNKWQNVWDPIDGIHQFIDPLGHATTVNFDPDGNVSTVVDANTHSTSYTYTSRDQLLTQTDPKSLQEQFTSYDPNGNLKTWIDRKGQTANYTYDALNRISTATYADGSVVTYTWDKANRLTNVSDTAGNTISRFYDGLDDLLCETPSTVSTLSACESAGAGTVYYSYTAAAQRATMNVNGQAVINYLYDNANRLTKITQGSYVIQKSYDNDSRLVTVTYTNGILGTYGYDAASELTSIVDTHSSSTVGTMYYTYDNDGRVTTRSGTLFQSMLPAAMAGAAYDADNRLCKWNVSSPSCSSPTITWDNNGNLTNDGTHAYTWDARNRLTAIPAYSAAYTYDALGRRLSNKKGATTTSFVYDFDNVVQEQQSGTPSANLLTGFGIDERFTRFVVGGAIGTYLTDALGSTLASANVSGVVTTNYAYDPFGNTTVSGTAGTNIYEFTGRENDGTGLYYNRARYYNPAWGRFIAEDPIGFRGGINRYLYVDADPITYLDPMGLVKRGGVGGSSGTGTGNPYKHCRPDKCKPGWIVCIDQKTGKKVSKRAPPDFPWEKYPGSDPGGTQPFVPQPYYAPPAPPPPSWWLPLLLLPFLFGVPA